jgi:hypothetical protein
MNLALKLPVSWLAPAGAHRQMKQGEGKLVLEVSIVSFGAEARWLHSRPDYVRIFEGVVLEAEQLYRGNRKYLRFDLPFERLFSSPPRATGFATVLLRSATPN